MKTLKQIGWAAMASAVLFASCSVERRHYRPGFHVNTGNHKPAAEAKADPKIKKDAPEYVIETPAEIVESTPVESASNNSVPETIVTAPEQKATIQKPAKAAAQTQIVQKHKPGKKMFLPQAVKRALTAQSPSGTMEIDIVALILAIFLGFIGIHRFYKGYIVSGILMILLFILATGWWWFGPVWFLGTIAGLALFAWVIVDIVFIVMERDLFFPK